MLFFACSIGTALAPNLAAFFVFRVLTAFEGTAFILVGSACIGDIYRPTERATALGWFMSGTLIGPALGPFIGGIIVTYASWRVIFWLQTGLSGLAALFTLTPLLPETIHHRKVDDLEGYSPRQKMTVLWGMINPARVLRLFVYPNLVAASLASSAVIWNMYSLLTPIRYVLNPRFHLTTPMQSGLFYLAPGTGYLVGTLVGGRYADHVVKSWIAKRDGVRVSEDRLRSAVPFMGVVIPACVLVYGWGVEKEAGGIPLAVVTLFVQGVAQLFCFPSLNTYCLDVMQGRGAEVIAGNYFVRYLFACAATACVLPAVQRIGVGWFSTISALFLMGGTAAVQATIWWGKSWRDRVDKRRRARRLAKQSVARKELGRRADGV
ncbi:MFS general substrate transporter [Thermothelomyces heterothallicus CBS 203.75]